MIAAIRGYRCILAVTDKSSQDKIDMLRALGAEVHVCPASVAADDPRSYYEVAKRIHRETPNSIYINQYFNPLNTEAHYLSTGREIWEQTAGQITHLVACSGTGGTISGIARYLKEQKPSGEGYWSRCRWLTYQKILRYWCDRQKWATPLLYRRLG